MCQAVSIRARKSYNVFALVYGDRKDFLFQKGNNCRERRELGLEKHTHTQRRHCTCAFTADVFALSMCAHAVVAKVCSARQCSCVFKGQISQRKCTMLSVCVCVCKCVCPGIHASEIKKDCVRAYDAYVRAYVSVCFARTEQY